jgi:hypothetical protein
MISRAGCVVLLLLLTGCAAIPAMIAGDPAGAYRRAQMQQQCIDSGGTSPICNRIPQRTKTKCHDTGFGDMECVTEPD